MVFPIVGGNESKDTQQNSLRFNAGDSPDLNRTPSSAGNRAVWTWSAWVKIDKDIQNAGIFTAGGWATGQDGTGLLYYNGQFLTYWNAPSPLSYSTGYYRDPAAWYHLVLQANTSTIKLYVNGVLENSDSISGDGAVNNTNEMVMGRYSNTTNSAYYYHGYMADVHFIDGTAKAHTDFGETNSNGVWIPKDYDGSYGTNGFRLEFQETGTSQNASGIGADTSGQGNHFAVNNLAATDVTTDSPTNNYATLNSILPLSSTATFSQGNLKFDGSAFRSPRATQGISNGKFYFEVLSSDPSSTDVHVGIATDTETGLDTWVGSTSAGYVYTGQSGQKYNNNSGSSYGATFTDGDIIGCAIDMDNGTLSFYKNNSSQGQAYSGLSGTVFPVISGTDIVVNFGQEGSFAGNKTAQGNSDANGYGDFYYSPPSGYYALNTKNLAEFG